MRRSKSIWRSALLAGALFCAGCGYTSEPLIESRYGTVYVETFDNDSRYRGYEVGLTRALINEINAKTDLRIVARDQADTVITGKIADFRQHVLTEDEDDNVRETEITLRVNMTWTDRRTGRPIRAIRDFAGAEQVKWELGQTVESQSVELFRDVAERLVERMEAPW